MSGINASYTTNIPFSTNNPSSDQPIMLQNANSINSLIGIDHSGFNTSDLSGGYHKIIHQPVTLSATTRSWTPVFPMAFTPAVATISNVNQLVPANYTPDYTGAVPDTQLFTITGQGGVSQLTGYESNPDGWQWIGGILLQWGVVTLPLNKTNVLGTVTFKDRATGVNNHGIPFPNNCFGVNLTLVNISEIATAELDLQDANTNAHFKWVFVGDTANFPKFYWFAWGN